MPFSKIYFYIVKRREKVGFRNLLILGPILLLVNTKVNIQFLYMMFICYHGQFEFVLWFKNIELYKYFAYANEFYVKTSYMQFPSFKFHNKLSSLLKNGWISKS